MTHRIAYVPGDGIGPEVLAVARRVLEAAGFEAHWNEYAIGWEEWCKRGEPLPAQTLQAIRDADATLFGAITSKPAEDAERELAPHLRGKGLEYQSPIVRLRQELTLGVNVRPCKSWPGNPNNLRNDVDVVIFRENTEDLYSGVEAHPLDPALQAALKASAPKGRVPDAGDASAVGVRVLTRAAWERLLIAAFEFAQRSNRKTVTLVDKPNVMRTTGRFLRQIFLEVSPHYPEIETRQENIDAACALMLRDPARFDVVVTTNTFGDILSDVAAEVSGGLALAPSANLGTDCAIFEPVHGSAPSIALTGRANPLAAVLAGAMMARHLGEDDVASRIEAAVADYLQRGRSLPRDLGGQADIGEVETELRSRLAAQTKTIN